MVESGELFNENEDVHSGTCDGVSEVRKRFPGVSKSGKRWRARLQHPKQKMEVYLGLYDSPEEAALALKKKRAEFHEKFNGENNNMNVKTCRDDFEGRQLPPGVDFERRGYERCGVRIFDPKLKSDISVGSYNTPEELALEINKVESHKKYGCKEKVVTNSEISKELTGEKSKMVEFDEKSNITEDGGSEVRKIVRGVHKHGNRWRARVHHPKLNSRISLGLYDSYKKAALAVKKKNDEFQEVKKSVRGVHKHGKRWRARVHHPKLKSRISLGLYDSYEKAALAVKKKNDEFQETFQGHNSCNAPREATIAENNKKDEFSKIYGFKHSCETDDKLLEKPNREVKLEKTCNGEENVKIAACGSEVRKRVCGVTKSGNRWRARIHHPKLKFEISLGSYGSQEEAALAVKKKKAEFLEMFKDDNSTNVKTPGDNFEGRQLPPGVSRRTYRRWSARVYDPKLKREISLGCYDTPEEAASAIDIKRDEFLKLYGWRPNKGTVDLAAQSDKANESAIERCPTPVLCSDNLDSISINDQLSNDVHSSNILVFEPEISDSADVGKRSMISEGNGKESGCVSEFDEAMSLGFINEYGQLLGIYSKLDEQMAFSFPDEDEVAY